MKKMVMIVLVYAVTWSFLHISQVLGAVISGPDGNNILMAKDSKDPAAPVTSRDPSMVYWNYNFTTTERSWMDNVCYQPPVNHWQTNGYCLPTVHHWKREVLYHPPVQHLNSLYNQPAIEQWNRNAHHNHVQQAWQNYVPQQPLTQDWSLMYNQPVSEYWKTVYNQPIAQHWNGVGSHQPAENELKADDSNHPVVKNLNSNDTIKLDVSANKLEAAKNSSKSLVESKKVKSEKNNRIEDESSEGLSDSLKKLPLVHDRKAKNSTKPVVKSKKVKAGNKVLVDEWEAVVSDQKFSLNKTVDEYNQTLVKTVDVGSQNQSMVGLNDSEGIDLNQPFVVNETVHEYNQTLDRTFMENSPNQPLEEQQDLNEFNEPPIIHQKVNASGARLVKHKKGNDRNQQMVHDRKADNHSQPVVKHRHSDSVHHELKADSANERVQNLTFSVERDPNLTLTDKPKPTLSKKHSSKKTADLVKTDRIAENYIEDTDTSTFAAQGSDTASVKLAKSAKLRKRGNIDKTEALASDTGPIVTEYSSKHATFSDATDSSGTRNISETEMLADTSLVSAASNIVEAVMVANDDTNVSTRNISEATMLSDAAINITSKDVLYLNAPNTSDSRIVVESLMSSDFDKNITFGNISDPKISSEVAKRDNISEAVTLGDDGNTSTTFSNSEITNTSRESLMLRDATKTLNTTKMSEDLMFPKANAATSNTSDVVKLSKTVLIPTNGNTSEEVAFPDSAEFSSANNTSEVVNITSSSEIPAGSNTSEVVTVRYTAENPSTSNTTAEFPTVNNTSEDVALPDADEIAAASNSLEVVTFLDPGEISVGNNTLKVVMIPDETSTARNASIALSFSTSAENSNVSQVVPFTDSNETVMANHSFESLKLEAPHTSNTSDDENIVDTNISSFKHVLRESPFTDDTELPDTSNSSEVVTFLDPNATLGTINTTDPVILDAESSMKTVVVPHANRSAVADNISEPMMLPNVTETLPTSHITNVEMFGNTKHHSANHVLETRSFADATETAADSNPLEPISYFDNNKVDHRNRITNAVNIANADNIPAASFISNHVNFAGLDKSASHRIDNTVNFGVAKPPDLWQNSVPRTFMDQFGIPNQGVPSGVNLGAEESPTRGFITDSQPSYPEIPSPINYNDVNALESLPKHESSNDISLINNSDIPKFGISNNVRVDDADNFKSQAQPRYADAVYLGGDSDLSRAHISNTVHLDRNGIPNVSHIANEVKIGAPATIPTSGSSSDVHKFGISNAVTFNAAGGGFSPQSDLNDDSKTPVQRRNSDTPYLHGDLTSGNAHISNVVTIGAPNTDGSTFRSNSDNPNPHILNSVRFDPSTINKIGHISNDVSFGAKPSTSQLDSDGITDNSNTNRISRDFNVNGEGSTIPHITNSVAFGGVDPIPPTRFISDVASDPYTPQTSNGHSISNTVTFHRSTDNPIARSISNSVNFAGTNDISSNHRISNSVTFNDVDQTPSASHISEAVEFPNTFKKSFEDALFIPPSNNSRTPNENYPVETDLPSQFQEKKHNSPIEEKISNHHTGNRLLEESTAQTVLTFETTKPDSESDAALPLGDATAQRNSANQENKDAANSRTTFGAPTATSKVTTVPQSSPPQQRGQFPQSEPSSTAGQWNYLYLPPYIYQRVGSSTRDNTDYSHVCAVCWTWFYGWDVPQWCANCVPPDWWVTQSQFRP